MIVRTTSKFRKSYKRLPHHVKESAFVKKRTIDFVNIGTHEIYK